MMKNNPILLPAFIFFSLAMFSNNLFGQKKTIDQQLFDQFETYKVEEIKHRRFKHTDIQPFIEMMRTVPDCQVRTVGYSLEKRPIKLVSIGHGPISVLLWSQMHGNEPSATMAIMDIFHFFKDQDNFLDFKSLITDQLTLHFIPMLNPDGAQRYQRRNAMGIDLNRDALRLAQPEAQILKRIRDSLQADWGFNLHDQSRYYAAGNHPKTAAISFLAPAYNDAKDINQERKWAMQLIGIMNNVLQKHIPGHIAKYNDAFEPRAFGDNIQKWGTSTILIETGGLPDDREKQQLRKMNYLALLMAFHSIASKSFLEEDLNNYQAIPFNKGNAFHELIIRQANVIRENEKYVMDIAFRSSEIQYNNYKDYELASYISDLGDLSTSFGYEVFDASNYRMEFGNTYSKVIRNQKQLDQLNIQELHQQGITRIVIRKPFPRQISKDIPLTLSTTKSTPNNRIGIGLNPDLVFYKDLNVVAIVVNGILYQFD